MDLGDASSFGEFEAALQGGRLVSQLSRLESALNLPVRMVRCWPCRAKCMPFSQVSQS